MAHIRLVRRLMPSSLPSAAAAAKGLRLRLRPSLNKGGPLRWSLVYRPSWRVISSKWDGIMGTIITLLSHHPSRDAAMLKRSISFAVLAKRPWAGTISQPYAGRTTRLRDAGTRQWSNGPRRLAPRGPTTDDYDLPWKPIPKRPKVAGQNRPPLRAGIRKQLRSHPFGMARACC